MRNPAPFHLFEKCVWSGGGGHAPQAPATPPHPGPLSSPPLFACLVAHLPPQPPRSPQPGLESVQSSACPRCRAALRVPGDVPAPGSPNIGRPCYEGHLGQNTQTSSPAPPPAHGPGSYRSPCSLPSFTNAPPSSRPIFPSIFVPVLHTSLSAALQARGCHGQVTTWGTV